MTDDLESRLDAVERAVTGDETDFAALADAASVDERLTTVEDRLDEVETRLADLDATMQAIRGYLSGVDGVTADVERQAALALAKAEAVESHVFDADDGLSVERLPATDDDAQTPADSQSDDSPDSHARGAKPALRRREGTGQSSPSASTIDSRVTEQDEAGSSLVTRLRDAL